jgi:hypothetical protein
VGLGPILVHVAQRPSWRREEYRAMDHCSHRKSTVACERVDSGQWESTGIHQKMHSFKCVRAKLMGSRSVVFSRQADLDYAHLVE